MLHPRNDRSNLTSTSTVRRLKTSHVVAAMLLMHLCWLTFLYVTGLSIFTESIPLLMVVSLLAGVLVLFLPLRLLRMLRQVKKTLMRRQWWLLVLLVALVSVQGLALAWLAPAYPDEKNHLEATHIIVAEGTPEFFARYSQLPWLGNKHPPLAPLLFGAVMRLVGSSLLVGRLLALAFSVGSVLLTFLLARRLYSAETALVSVLLLLSFPRFLRLSLQANNDIPTMFLFMLALFLTWQLYQCPSYQTSLLAGLTIGLGLLTKYTMALIYPVVLGFLVITKSLRPLKRHVSILLLVSGALLLAWLAYAATIGVFTAQAEKITALAGVTNNESGEFRLLSSYRTAMRLDYLVETPLAIGAFVLPLLLLGAIALIKQRSPANLFIMVWIAGVIVPITVLLPEIRYLLPALPALAIIGSQGLQYWRIVPEPIILLGWLLYLSQGLAQLG